MGRLYDMVKELELQIEKTDADFYESLGFVSMKAGFLMSLVSPDTPDDPEKINALRTAAQNVLGLRL